jgi:hypothetical protein
MPGKAVAALVSTGDLDRCSAGVVGESRRGGEADGPSGTADQPARHDRPDPDGPGQRAAGRVDEFRDSPSVQLQLSAQR